MSANSKIEWTDATWNVITGCDIESPGCKNCYAMKLAGTRLRNHPSRAGLTKDSAAGPVWTGEVRFNEQWLRQPLERKRARIVFVVAHGDLFHPMVPFAWIDLVVAVTLLARQHTYQILTKRTARMAEYFAGLRTPAGYARLETAARSLGFTLMHEGTPLAAWPFENLWLGTSVENQRNADERRKSLRAIADLGFRTWVSYEPALGPVDWAGWEFLRWLVAGGESGPGARPSHPDWHRAARDFFSGHGIDFHFKQWGSWAVGSVEAGGDLGGDIRRGTAVYLRADGSEPDGHAHRGDALMRKTDKKTAGRLLDGREWNEMPS